ncbi:MAG TPA: selenocysteine-specific translation elongation factor [Longimicrobiales bacterium]|nr:selenocysteine-specific translation elongation factor [Longimicrobiales bacterium]
MNRVIMGTAGHIDHGKTALVRALTGVDTDRLPEEKARGITIDLGFAELADLGDLQVGVVDVPGHEDFVRTMVAGASGMDLVLLVVAADEGLMPQTREHFDIIRLLDVPEMVVALTKIDAVDPEWAELVSDDVRALLADTSYAEAPILATSARVGTGMEELRREIRAAALRARPRTSDDLTRLPVDRVFTVPGRGTVVTGTLWSGSLRTGATVRMLPEGKTARIRSLQVHGRDVDAAWAGERTAVALAGVDRQEIQRGAVLVSVAGWEPTWMLTTLVRVLATAKPLEHGQRVRVHLGTAEVLARCAVLEGSAVPPGASGWVQLRLESPTVSRARDRVVLRSYSPLSTLGGGLVAEPRPAKRRRVNRAQDLSLRAVLDGTPEEAALAVLEMAGWSGVATESLPALAGISPGDVGGCASVLQAKGGLVGKGLAFSPDVVAEASALVLSALERGHREEPLRPAVALERVRGALPEWAARELADLVVTLLQAEGALELAEGGARRPGFQPCPTADQERAADALTELFARSGLAAPFLDDLPLELRGREDLGQLLHFLERRGVLRTVDAGLFIASEALDRAARAVTERLGGRSDLGPADFREVLDVSRKHLMPLLAHLDGLGVTVRRGPARDVPPATPGGAPGNQTGAPGV